MALIDRRFMDIRLVVQGIANDVPVDVTPYNGIQFIVGDAPTGAFAGANANDIASYNGTTWTFFPPTSYSMEFLDVSQNCLLRYTGTEFETVATLGAEEFFEVHHITSANLATKSFDLDYRTDTIDNMEITVIVGGLTHIENVDYQVGVAGDVVTVSWGGKELDSIGISENDVFLVHVVLKKGTNATASGSNNRSTKKVEMLDNVTLGAPDARMPSTPCLAVLVPDWGVYIWTPDADDAPDGETCVLPASGDVGRWKISVASMDFYYDLKSDMVDEIRSYSISGSATLTWPSLAAYGGTAVRTIPVEGAMVGDIVTVYSPSMTDKVVYTGYVSAPNVVSVRAVNASNAAITPAAAVWYAYVHREVFA